MPIAYAAHTETATFFLDDDGVCRQIVRRAVTMKGIGNDDSVGRCIGAQYVASIDVQSEGGLAPLPIVGAPMLFAYVGDGGRIALVRTGRLTKFEPKNTRVTQTEAREEPPVQEQAGRAKKGQSGIRELSVHELDVEMDADDDDGDDARTQRFFGVDDGAQTQRFHAATMFPKPAPRHPHASRPAPPRAATPLPVRRVTMVPPAKASASSAPTLPRTEVEPARGRGMLPSRRRA